MDFGLEPMQLLLVVLLVTSLVVFDAGLGLIANLSRGIVTLAAFLTAAVVISRGDGQVATTTQDILSRLPMPGPVERAEPPQQVAAAPAPVEAEAEESGLPRVRTFVSRDIQLRRSLDGHFYTDVQVNGSPIRFVVDTGATLVVLTKSDAQKAGLNPDRLRYSGRAQTANGAVSMAPVMIERMGVNGVELRNVQAAVNAGQMQTSLLGMSYLSEFASIEMRGNTLVLTPK